MISMGRCAIASVMLSQLFIGVSLAQDSTSHPWLTRRQAEIGVAALGATLLLAPIDHSVADEVDEPRWKDSRPIQRDARAIAFLGSDGPVLISAALYATGLAAHVNPLTRIALHNTEAIILAAGVAGLAKGVFGRALPGVSTKHEFSFGRGFHDGNGPFVSFPSGHTAAAFAMAAALSGEVQQSAPSVATFFTPAAYTSATLVGLARVFQRVHWPSDLPLAAAIGVWSGTSIESHTQRRHGIRAAMNGITVSPSSDGRLLVGWSSRQP